LSNLLKELQDELLILIEKLAGSNKAIISRKIATTLLSKDEIFDFTSDEILFFVVSDFFTLFYKWNDKSVFYEPVLMCKS
jgi:hypothetical protein